MSYRPSFPLSTDLIWPGDPVYDGGKPLPYLFTVETAVAVDVALATRRPLLVAGPPGSGKSRLAPAMAGLLWWAFDPESARRRGGTDEQIQSLGDRFQTPEPPPTPGAGDPGDAVLLLDEIDKADPDLPNDLLEPLDRMAFQVPDCPPVTAPLGMKLLVIITTNGERDLPPVIRLLFAPEDKRLVAAVMEVLQAAGIDAEPVDPEEALAMASSGELAGAPSIMLWSASAREGYGGMASEGVSLFTRGLVLVTDDAPLLEGMAEVQVVDLRKWDGDPAGELSEELAKAARGLLAGEAEDASGGWKPPDLDGRLPMVVIPGGKFLMGSPPEDEQARDHERPQHEVTISTFALSQTTVTRGLYREFMDEYPKEWDQDEDDDRLPANYISWFNTVAFCNRLSKEAGLTPCYDIDNRNVIWDRNVNGYRLPTEAEWEYACRAGTTTRWFWGNDEADSQKYVAQDIADPVAEKSPNPWDLYDMAGNVVEWCWDWYGAYSEDAWIDPTGPSDGTLRVLRGGAFRNEPWNLRSAFRFDLGPELRYWFIGFRVACPGHPA